VESATFEGEVPSLVAENAIELDQGWAPAFIAPHELPILEAQLLKLAEI
jgi:hypothetical protein